MPICSHPFLTLAAALDCSTQDFHCHITSNPAIVFLSYPFWEQHDFGDAGVDAGARKQVLSDVRMVWAEAFPDIPLGCQS